MGLIFGTIFTLLGWTVPKHAIKYLYQKRCDLFTDQMVDAMTEALPGSAWKIRLRDDGDVEWVDVSGDEEIVFSTNPQTDFALRQRANLSNINLVEGQL